MSVCHRRKKVQIGMSATEGRNVNVTVSSTEGRNDKGYRVLSQKEEL